LVSFAKTPMRSASMSQPWKRASFQLQHYRQVTHPPESAHSGRITANTEVTQIWGNFGVKEG
jgi:hypothetical protein